MFLPIFFFVTYVPLYIHEWNCMKLADDYSAIMEAMRNVLNTSQLSSPAPPSALLGGGYSNENLKTEKKMRVSLSLGAALLVSFFD